jgi:hypothetical protein
MGKTITPKNLQGHKKFLRAMLALNGLIALAIALLLPSSLTRVALLTAGLTAVSVAIGYALRRDNPA